MKIRKYGCWLNLIRIYRQIEDFSGHMNRVGDNDNLENAIKIWGLVDTASDNKKFCFSACDVNHMMNSFCDGTIVSVCMQYRYSNVVLDASICGYNGSRRGDWWLYNYIVKLLRVKFIVFLLVMNIKSDTIWETINDSKTRRKFRMKRNKRRENSIKPISCIY